MAASLLNPPSLALVRLFPEILKPPILPESALMVPVMSAFVATRAPATSTRKGALSGVAEPAQILIFLPLLEPDSPAVITPLLSSMSNWFDCIRVIMASSAIRNGVYVGSREFRGSQYSNHASVPLLVSCGAFELLDVWVFLHLNHLAFDAKIELLVMRYTKSIYLSPVVVSAESFRYWKPVAKRERR